MAYGSRGRRPIERASKSSHHYLINDASVVDVVTKSWLPPVSENTTVFEGVPIPKPEGEIPFDHFIAIDGSYQETVVRPEYPSSTLCFMQFGALAFSRDDLLLVDRSPHPAPEDMERLRNLERLKLAFPLKNMRFKEADSLADSIRMSVFQFFTNAAMSGTTLIDTLKWFVFREYDGERESRRTWHLATNPCSPDREGVSLVLDDMRNDFTFSCPRTGKPIYLTDVLRIHERIDEDLGAGGILGYLMTSIEQLLVVHILRLITRRRPAALSKIVIIKDGPLAFFGVTANLHTPMRALISHLSSVATPNLIGVEKSGPFVDHAHQIRNMLRPGEALILNDAYIYKNVLASGNVEDNGRSYGSSTYYGRKVIFKSRTNMVHVVTIPTDIETSDPRVENFFGFEKCLQAVEILHCDMYDDALFPVALANKLVSLSAHPSQRILERFATHSVGAQ